LYILFDIQIQLANEIKNLIDEKLQLTNKEIIRKDLKVMKILQDLKNPVSSLINTINDPKIDRLALQNITNDDLEDID